MHKGIELKNSEMKYYSLLENLPIGVFQISTESADTIQYMNNHLRKILGIKDGKDPEELSFKNFISDKNLLSKIIKKLNSEDKYFSEEITFKNHNGNEINSRLIMYREINGDNGKENFIGILEDVTDSKKLKDKLRKIKEEAENDLKESEAKFKDILYSMADWIWEVDAEGRYTYCSEKVYEILGYTTDEMLGKTPFEYMPENEAIRVGEVFAKFVEQAEPFKDLENWNVHKKGHLVCLSTSGVPIFNDNNELIGYRGVDKDITENKKAAEVIIESEKRFKKFFNEIPDAIFLTRIGGKIRGEILDFNPAAEKQTGYSRRELIGKNLMKLLAAEKVDVSLTKQRESDLFNKNAVQFVEKNAAKMDRYIGQKF